jgi:putative lipoprotein
MRFFSSALLLVLAASCRGGAFEPDEGHLSGTIFYRERVALPEGARVELRLVDVTVPGEEPPVIASAEWPVAGSVPLPFDLVYERARVETERDYALEGSIWTGDQRLFVTLETNLVLTRGRPRVLDLLVKPPGE